MTELRFQDAKRWEFWAFAVLCLVVINAGGIVVYSRNMDPTHAFVGGILVTVIMALVYESWINEAGAQKK